MDACGNTCEATGPFCDVGVCSEGICLNGSTPEAAGQSCKSLKEYGATASNLYYIDPDGAGGEDPFQVECDMVTEGGGWIVLSLTNSQSLYMAQNSPSNPWLKCGDDSVKHYGWLTEGEVSAEANEVNVDLEFLLEYEGQQLTVTEVVAVGEHDRGRVRFSVADLGPNTNSRLAGP